MSCFVGLEIPLTIVLDFIKRIGRKLEKIDELNLSDRRIIEILEADEATLVN